MKHRIIMIGKNEFHFVLIHVIEGNMLAILTSLLRSMSTTVLSIFI